MISSFGERGAVQLPGSPVMDDNVLYQSLPGLVSGEGFSRSVLQNAGSLISIDGVSTRRSNAVTISGKSPG